MRVKICGIQNELEMALAIKSGADAIGFQVGQLHRSKSFILSSTANRLAHDLPPYITPVIVTHMFEAEDVMDILDKAGIFTVQLHNSSPEQVAKLRDMMPENGKIILTEYICSLSNDGDLSDYYSLIDAVNLDCFNPLPGSNDMLSGNRFDFDGSAEFVRKCPLPVILSGGLDASVVAQAIEKVKPFGVDACRGLKNNLTSCCEPQSCFDFVFNAKKTFFEQLQMESGVLHENN